MESQADPAYSSTTSDDLMPMVIPAFQNIGHALFNSLSNFPQLAAAIGVKTRESWTAEPLYVTLFTCLALVLAASATMVS